MAGQWFYTSNGGQAGPVDTADLRRLVGEGALRPTDLVWREGLAEWMPASQVPGLFGAAEGEAAAADVSTEGSPVAGPGPGAAPYYPAPPAVLPYQGGGVPVGISARTMELLRQTRPWVIFFSVLGFLLTGLMLLAGTVVTFAGLATPRGSRMPALVGLVYIAFSAVYLFPALFLWRYGMRIGSLVARGQVEDLESALEAQKSFWRLSGIIVIAAIVLYFVVIAVAIAVNFG
ncbi:MAG: hypothetical protein AVDCRST_MAG64-359 [uncultured Phycisphaerae bacterium]|uniref:GYF domain-containing protein n=1 Tax=uncultured Phycisphaerae bacterium TaxID=904963 RepID=A0A6J4N8I9_9BACT|nr:MAG: hypothetical protein AVDCRST_MAG64-359 [uncultured Phycisphaerae bacterium]